MEYWDFEKLEYWDVGILRCWNIEVLEYWDIGILINEIFGYWEDRDIGIQR